MNRGLHTKLKVSQMTNRMAIKLQPGIAEDTHEKGSKGEW